MLMDDEEAARYKGWEEHRKFMEENKQNELSDCKSKFHECKAELKNGSIHCVECKLSWGTYERKPTQCKADQANKHLIKILGCKAYEKENGFMECKHCKAKFLSEMKRPPQCIALQKLLPTNDADHEQQEKPRPKMTDGEVIAVIFGEMAATFKERNTTYGSNYKHVPKMVAVLFPDGVSSELVGSDQWHLFELILVKLSRFAVSQLTHKDSIHDAAVYSAMIEMILTQKEKLK